MTDWSEEHDYRERWSHPADERRSQQRREFFFREAGVARFNDLVDEIDDDAEREA